MWIFFFQNFLSILLFHCLLGWCAVTKMILTKRAFNYCYYQMLRNTEIPEAPMFKPEFPPQGLFLFFSFLIISVDKCTHKWLHLCFHAFHVSLKH